MDRKLFEERLNQASSQVSEVVKHEAETKVIDPNPIYVGAGTRNLIIVIEELAELQQQLSKYLRGNADRIGLIEEYADVVVGLDYIKHICNITDEEINKAINVKIDRLQNTDGIFT